MQWFNEHRNLAILGVLLLAAALRLQEINEPYVDVYAWRETDVASIADAFAGGNWNIFLPQVRWGGPGPNYVGAEFQTVSYIAALGYRVFGTDPWIGRSVSIAFGLWGIFALYNLVCRVWDRPRAVASAAVMAVLPGSVFIERSFLSDGAMTALMTTSLWMLVAYGQTERQKYLFAAAISGVLGCLTKLPGGILVIPAMYVVISMFGTRLGRRRILGQLAAAALLVAIPVIVYYLWARHVALSTPPHHFTGEGKFLWNSSLSAWVKNYYFLPVLWETVASELWSFPFIALATVGTLLPHRAYKPSGALWFFHAWLIAMIVRYLIEAQHLVSDPYNLHLFNPVVAAFGGHALAALASNRSLFRGKGLRPVSILILAGSAAYGQIQAHHLFADSYREHYVLGQILAEISRPKDLIISMGPEPVVLYHSRRNGWLFPPSEPSSATAASFGNAWDYAHQDVSLLHELRSRGGQWIAIPSWNGYTGGSGQDFLRLHYPVLYAGILEAFEVVREIPEGLILRAK